MTRLLNRVCSAMAVLGGLLLLFITFSIAYSIVTRKLDLPTPVWVVQFNEYALLWVPFLATAWILSRVQHVSVQFLVLYLGKKGRKVLDIIHSFMGMILCGIFCWYGINTTWDHFVRGVTDVASVDVPKAYVLVIIPVGFFLLTLQFLSKFLFGLLGTEGDDDQSGQDSETGGDL
jgi:C4-dicarboxylate transporter, DctQ subunit